jgi:hypothetical protein
MLHARQPCLDHDRIPGKFGALRNLGVAASSAELGLVNRRKLLICRLSTVVVQRFCKP